PFACLMLLNPTCAWVACWVDDPADKRIEVDICLLPERGSDAWSYVDLELDVFRHADGTVTIEDHDEFDLACRNVWIRPEHARLALETVVELELALRNYKEPFGGEGWGRLDARRSSPGNIA